MLSVMCVSSLLASLGLNKVYQLVDILESLHLSLVMCSDFLIVLLHAVAFECASF